MKRMLGILALLLVLGVAIVVTLRRAGGFGTKFPASRAAELAPASTVFFVHAPDFERTLARWEKSEVREMTQEPGWPDSWHEYVEGCFLLPFRKWGEGAMAARLLPELAKTKPAGAFLAMPSLDWSELPALVGGLQYRGRKSDLEQMVRVWKEHLFTIWPAAKSELAKHSGVEIESIRKNTPAKDVPVPSVLFAFRDDWLFFATDRALLTGLLDRYLQTPGAAPRLAADPVFQRGRAQEVADPDAVAWARWEPAGKKLAEAWSPVAIFPLPDPPQAAHYSMRLDGDVRDRLYFALPAPPDAAPLTSEALALTTPDGAGLAVFQFDALRGGRIWRGLLPAQERAGVTRALAAQPKPPAARLDYDALWEAFGPEICIVFPKQNTPARPRRVLALRVRDAAKARAMVDLFTANLPSVTVSTEGEITRWDWAWSTRGPRDSLPRFVEGVASGEIFPPPPIVLTKTHVLFGPDAHAATETLEKSAQRGPTLESSPGYAAAMRGIEPPNGALLYFDPARLFRSPVIGQSSSENESFLPYVADPVTQYRYYLPQVALERHLRPGIVTVRAAGSGWLVESRLSIVGNYIVLRLLTDER